MTNINSVDLISQYFELTELQKIQFGQLLELYSDWNSKINVISRKDIDNFYERHVLHSLSIAKTEMIKSGDKILDLGCGGGFPVVPLAILYPDVEFTAVDSIGKKIKVVQAVVESLGLENVTTHNCRVETLGDKWDWVISRAVAPLGDLLSWTKGSFSKGMLLLKGGDLTLEIKDSRAKLSNIELLKISEIFRGEFFGTKSIVKYIISK